MKSLTLTAASLLLAGTAYAQSTSEIYGKMRIYSERDKVGTAEQLTKQTSNGSWLGFRGTEDLGNGLRANFVIEQTIVADAPAATSMGDRQSTVGLGNALGSFSLGRDKHAIARLFDQYDAFGNPAVYSSVGTVHSAQGARLSNGAFAIANVGPVTIRLNHGASETAATPSVLAGGVDIKAGNGSLGYARYDNRVSSTSDVYAASYGIRQTGTTLMAIYSNDQVLGHKTDGKSVGVRQNLTGAWTLLATYGEKQDFNATNLGLNYALSKRTAINVRYKNEDSNVASADRRQYGIGIDHNF